MVSSADRVTEIDLSLALTSGGKPWTTAAGTVPAFPADLNALRKLVLKGNVGIVGLPSITNDFSALTLLDVRSLALAGRT